MNLFNKVVVLMFLIGFCMPAYSAVERVELFSCDVYSADEENGEKVDEEDEEPDCE
ncbi:MAG: hypothetical protein JKX75_04485 [Gammaproteobacteria bacterium]|nr:hypothetical protein [Gammaproteobacteria bacterium]